MLNLDAVIGLPHYLNWIAVNFFGSFWNINCSFTKLGMHKMELGDRVYAAERIMKKRIRKVSFVYIFKPC